MREIKFRAWIKENYYDDKPYMLRQVKAVEPNGDIQIDLAFHETKGWYDCHSANEIELMQYTGINDKNGTEIYDGDIIKFSERSINGFISTHVCRVFQSENGAWRVEGHPDFDTSYITRRELYLIRKICEVIGNVYGNPELLKEGK